LQVMTQTRDRKVFGSAAGRDASIADAAAQRTRAALILALESDTGGAHPTSCSSLMPPPVRPRSSGIPMKQSKASWTSRC
jgi:hypothetical protein